MIKTPYGSYPMAEWIQRWAILVGVDTTYGLGDIVRFKEWLKTNRDMTDANMTCLTTTEPRGTPNSTADYLPSRSNITKALKNRLDNSKKGDSVFFHFAGRGVRGGSVVDCHGEHIPASVLMDLFEKMAEKGLILNIKKPTFGQLTSAHTLYEAFVGPSMEGWDLFRRGYERITCNPNPQLTIIIIFRNDM